MVTMTLHPERRMRFGEVETSAPYELVGWFLQEDVHSAVGARDLLGRLRAVMAGSVDREESNGDAYELVADRASAKITTILADPPQEVALPTAWLIDALEKWCAYLEAHYGG